MDIEPLKTYLQNKGDKRLHISYFLNDSINKRLTNSEYIERGILINDKLKLIKKNTLELEYIGKVYCIDKETVGIKLSQYRNVTIKCSEYYIFREIKKKTKRELMETLLETL